MLPTKVQFIYTPNFMNNAIKDNILPIAAPVFAVGKFAQSPRANTFLYLTCCIVSPSTLTNPAASTKSDAFNRKHSGVVIGGATWRISYGTVVCEVFYRIRKLGYGITSDLYSKNEAHDQHFWTIPFLLSANLQILLPYSLTSLQLDNCLSSHWYFFLQQSSTKHLRISSLQTEPEETYDIVHLLGLAFLAVKSRAIQM